MAKVLLGFLIVVVALCGAAYANYERNAPLDAELRDRPYAGLADKDLKALLDAYKAEKRGYQTQLAKSGGDRTTVMDGLAPADYHGKVKAFESFQRQNERWRDVNRQRLSHEVEVEKLEREASIRARGLHIEKNRILRRLTTF